MARNRCSAGAPSSAPNCGQPLVQPGQADRIFEVEVVGRVGGNELPGQRGLAALARPDDGDDGGTAERLLDQGLRGAGDQGMSHLFHDNTHVSTIFS